MYGGRIITQAEVAAQWHGQDLPTSAHSQYESMLHEMDPHDLADLRRGRLLGVCTYNPQHFCSPGRMAEVMHTLDRYQIQIFPGTRFYAKEPRMEWTWRDPYPDASGKHRSRHIISWPAPQRSGPAAHTGLMITLGGRLGPTDIHTRHDPPPELRGRVGALRLVRRHRRLDQCMDILIIGCYAFGEGNEFDNQRENVWEWIMELLVHYRATCQRCTPIFAGDMQAHLRRARDAIDRGVGTISMAHDDNRNGQHMRRLLEMLDLVSCLTCPLQRISPHTVRVEGTSQSGTIVGTEATYHNAMGATQIDLDVITQVYYRDASSTPGAFVCGAGYYSARASHFRPRLGVRVSGIICRLH